MPEESIQIHVLVLRVECLFLSEEAVGNLGVENAVAVHLEVADESTCVLATVVEYFDDCGVFQNILQDFGESWQLDQVEDKAMACDTHLEK